MKKIATIARNPLNSPNMTDKDSAILECIRAELGAMGAEVIDIGEDEEIPAGIHAVCSMSRTESVLAKLKKAEEMGTRVFNSTKAVESCSRIQFMEILHKNDVPQPPYTIVEDKIPADTTYPCWIKQATGWSCHKNDVCHVSTVKEAEDAIKEMKLRGHDRCIAMQHCKGHIVKFYGIGEEFFHYHIPECGSTKFGLEVHNDQYGEIRLDAGQLRQTAQKAAKAIGLDIYGGDCIVTPEGEIHIIDMNDFPSFSAVRQNAARAIAELIMKQTYNK